MRELEGLQGSDGWFARLSEMAAASSSSSMVRSWSGRRGSAEGLSILPAVEGTGGDDVGPSEMCSLPLVDRLGLSGREEGC